MLDFLGKKTRNNGENNVAAPGQVTGNPNSLLDVVVPFPDNFDQSKKDRHDSLLSQFEDLSRQRDQTVFEKHELERAELRAKRAQYEQAEQQARIDAEREESRLFEEKANKLAAEIERVRGDKIQELNAAEANQPPHYGRSGQRHRDPYAPQQSTPYPPAEGQQFARPAQDFPEQARYRPQETVFHPVPPHSDQAPEHLLHRYPPQQPPEMAPRYPEPPKPQYASWPSPETGSMPPPDRDRATVDYSPPYPYDPRSGTGSPRDYPPNGWWRDYANDYNRPPEPRSYQPSPEQRSQQLHHREYASGTSRQPTRDADYPDRQQSGINSPPVRQPEAREEIGTAQDSLYGQDSSPAETNGFTLDIDAALRSVLSSWKLITMMAIIGAVVAGIYAKSLPNEYQAWAELSLDPRDLNVIDSQLTSSGFGGEAMIANLESQLRIIESSSVLNAVIDDVGLMDDPEFTGRSAGVFGILDTIFPPPQGLKASNDRQLVLEKLQDALSLSRGNRTFIISIGITTEDSQKSARIANAVARAYVNGEVGARSRIARNASEILERKLETLRTNVLNAERAVNDYKTRNGLISSEGKLTTEVQLSRLNEQLANAKVETINAKSRMEQARSTDLGDVVSGALPVSLNSSTISSLRIRYSTLKSNADRLATKLGPKHPERIAAQAELGSTRNQIRQEIRRLINGASKGFDRAKKRQQSLKQQVVSLEAKATGVGASQIELRDLESKLEAHDKVYKAYLLRSRETGEQEGLTTTNTREISEATPPLEKIGPRRKIIAGIGLAIGGLVGFAMAVLQGMFGWSFPGRSSKVRATAHGQNRNYPHPDENVHKPQAPYRHYPPSRENHYQFPGGQYR